MFGRPKPRKQHPDPLVEAQLQYVLSLYAVVTRTEDRIEDIRLAQQKVDADIRYYATTRNISELKDQAAQLRDERDGLEASLSETHARIVKLLTDLGDGALYLGPVPS
jgi:predicted  nucleic acid-binding Zn-ribbon protein